MLLQQHASTIPALDVAEVQSAFGASPSTRVLQDALTALLAAAQLPLQLLSGPNKHSAQAVHTDTARSVEVLH